MFSPGGVSKVLAPIAGTRLGSMGPLRIGSRFGTGLSSILRGIAPNAPSKGLSAVGSINITACATSGNGACVNVTVGYRNAVHDWWDFITPEDAHSPKFFYTF